MRIATLFSVALAAIVIAPAAQAAPIQPQPVRGQSGRIDFFNPTPNPAGMFLRGSGRTHSVSTLYRSARADAAILTGTHTLSPFLRSGAVNLDNVTDTPTPSPEPPSLLLLGTGILGLAILARRRLARV